MKKEDFIKFLVIVINVLVFYRIYDIAILNKDYYSLRMDEVNNRIISIGNPPRGRILDVNGKVIVDNVGIKSLIFYSLNYKNEDILEYSNKLSSILNMNSKDIYNSIINGYKFEYKVIKNNLSSEEINQIYKLDLDSFYIINSWERVYNYDTSINQILGNVGSIYQDELSKYLSQGYKISDLVGVSFLEKYYEKYLKGEKAKYYLKDDLSLELISGEKKGMDLVLNIDIDLQLKLDDLLKKEITSAKKVLSSKFYNGSYIMISDTRNGAIKAMSAYKYDDGLFRSDVIGLFSNSYTVGSVVKGASLSVGYINNSIDIDKKIDDSCIKLFSQNKKCSWKRLGYINDIDSLTYSSNYYQFITAIKVNGDTYKYNMKFNPKLDTFNKYRTVFSNYGLGSKTGVDLYEEKLGIIGKNYQGDLLLNLSIGQYDTYSPAMLNNYISTIANDGYRHKLRIGSYLINDEGNVLNINSDQIISKVDIDKQYIDRIKTGLNNVMIKGTGSSYVTKSINSAGKTGTSETFYNGVSTTTRSFIMYLPFDDPKYSISIISPNISYNNSINNHKYPINSKLSREIVNILFEK